MIICGTGHRPNKLGGYTPEVDHLLRETASLWLCKHMPELVISGGALGWDQALVEGAWTAGLVYDMYLPFDGFDCKWPDSSRRRLERYANLARQVKFVCDPGYAPWKMQKRNEAMVDACTDVLALWNGSDGGTGNCLRYARSKNKPIINLWDKYETIRG
jgi:uncharacterized phage-like protein YoqJ